MSTAAQSRTKAASPIDDTELDDRYNIILLAVDKTAEERKFTKELTITTEERVIIEPWLRRKEYLVLDGSAYDPTASVELGWFKGGQTQENIVISWQGYELSVNKITAAVGETITWTIDTQGVDDGDVIYYNITGTAVSTDFTDNDLSAGVVATANQAVITKTIDAAAVAGHTIDLKIYYDGLLTEELAQATTVTIV